MTPEENKIIAQDMGSLAHDPLRWVLYAYRWNDPDGPLAGMTGPQRWQMEHLDHVGRCLREDPYRPVRVAVASGHGVGKSAIVAWYTAWGLSTFPNTRIVITANTFPQLKTKTFPELSTWWQRCIVKDWFTCEGMRMWFSAQKGFESTWRCDGITWSVNNTEAFAGLHNRRKRIIVIMDEASAIDDSIWEVTEGALTDSQTEILWLVFGNPTRNTGRFYECFHKYRDYWKNIKVDSRSVDITNKDLLKEWEEQYGIDSDFYRVRVLGEFPNASVAQFIPASAADAAQGRQLPADSYSFAPKILGVDVAMFGGDRSVIFLRQGLYSNILYQACGNTPEELAGHAARLYDEYDADALIVDATGVGEAVMSALRLMHRSPIAFYAAERSLLSNCANRRTEVWYKMRDWLSQGGAIPLSSELYDDLTGPEYQYTGSNKIQLERKADMKKRGLASPDLADALALTFAADVPPKEGFGGYFSAGSYATADDDYDIYS